MRDQNQPPDYYEILGVPHDASEDEIRRAYRREAMTWHPDRNKNPNAPRMMQLINRAWETLGDSEKRAAHDREIAERARSRATAGSQQDPVEEFSESLLPWLLERAIDLYDALGVSINSTFEEIDRAYIYRQQNIEQNPEFTGDPAASAFMNLVRIAHTVLSDPEFRAEYDQHYFLLRSKIAEEERARQEASRREFERQEQKRRREQARREAEAQRQRDETERRRRQARERRVRETHERRERERQRTEAQNQRENGKQWRTTKTSTAARGRDPFTTFTVLLTIIVGIVIFLVWLNRDEQPPRPNSNVSRVFATHTPRPTQSTRPIFTPTPEPAAASASVRTQTRSYIFGPESGSIEHDPDDGFIDEYDISISIDVAVIEARFFTRYSAQVGEWSSGFCCVPAYSTRFMLSWYPVKASGITICERETFTPNKVWQPSSQTTSTQIETVAIRYASSQEVLKDGCSLTASS